MPGGPRIPRRSSLESLASLPAYDVPTHDEHGQSVGAELVPPYLQNLPTYDTSQSHYAIGSVSFWSADSAQPIRHRSILELEPAHSWRKNRRLLPMPEHAMGLVVVGKDPDIPDRLRWNLGLRVGPSQVRTRATYTSGLATFEVADFIDAHPASDAVCFYVRWNADVHGVDGETVQTPIRRALFVGKHEMAPVTQAYPSAAFPAANARHGDRYRIGSLSATTPGDKQTLSLRDGTGLKTAHNCHPLTFSARPIPREALGIALVARSEGRVVWHVARKDSQHPHHVYFRRSRLALVERCTIAQFLYLTSNRVDFSGHLREHYYVHWDPAYGHGEQAILQSTVRLPPLINRHEVVSG